MNIKTVYLLTGGEYSDYRVHGVYSTQDLAIAAKSDYETHSTHRHGMEFRIEECVMDFVPRLPDGMKAWKVRFNENGDVMQIGNVRWDDITNALDHRWGYRGTMKNGIITTHTHLEVDCFAASKEAAIKIGHERWAVVKATEPWPSVEQVKAMQGGEGGWLFLDGEKTGN